MVCHLTANDQSRDVKASSIRPTSKDTITICAGCFEKVKYAMALPSTIEGVVTLKITEALRIGFAIVR